MLSSGPADRITPVTLLKNGRTANDVGGALAIDLCPHVTVMFGLPEIGRERGGFYWRSGRRPCGGRENSVIIAVCQKQTGLGT